MAAGQTYTPIESKTLAANTTTVTFSNIPSTYTDLVLIADPATVANGKTIFLTFNSDTGANYSYTNLDGTGSAAASSRASNASQIQIESTNVGTSSTLGQSMLRINIMNYSNTTTYKTALCRIDNNGSSFPGVAMIVGLWRSTSAISSFSITTTNSQQLAGATFSLYGIAKA